MAYESRQNDEYGEEEFAEREGRSEGDPLGLKRRGGKKRICKFCADPALPIDYKDSQAMRAFITERGKIVPRRISGACAKHQRAVTVAVKRARNIVIMPFTSVA